MAKSRRQGSLSFVWSMLVIVLAFAVSFSFLSCLVNFSLSAFSTAGMFFLYFFFFHILNLHLSIATDESEVFFKVGYTSKVLVAFPCKGPEVIGRLHALQAPQWPKPPKSTTGLGITVGSTRRFPRICSAGDANPCSKCAPKCPQQPTQA